jgi:hypothetical protein
MADEQDVFAGRGVCPQVVGFGPGKPVEIGFFPRGIDGIEGAAGAAT